MVDEAAGEVVVVDGEEAVDGVAVVDGAVSFDFNINYFYQKNSKMSFRWTSSLGIISRLCGYNDQAQNSLILFLLLLFHVK